MTNQTLSAERARELFSYDPLTGVFTRRAGPFAGRTTGTVSRGGYVYIGYGKSRYLAHRLAWLMSSGGWPQHDVDHVNGDKADNSLKNLRDIPHRANCENQRQAHLDSRSGGMGVVQRGRRFRAYITLKGKAKYLGSFSTPEAAHEAYLIAKRELHTGCTI